MKNYILRKIKGKSHIFLDKRGNLIKDKKYIDKCLEGVYIAPAYDDVKINLNKKTINQSASGDAIKTLNS